MGKSVKQRSTLLKTPTITISEMGFSILSKKELSSLKKQLASILFFPDFINENHTAVAV